MGDSTYRCYTINTCRLNLPFDFNLCPERPGDISVYKQTSEYPKITYIAGLRQRPKDRYFLMRTCTAMAEGNDSCLHGCVATDLPGTPAYLVFGL